MTRYKCHNVLLRTENEALILLLTVFNFSLLPFLTRRGRLIVTRTRTRTHMLPQKTPAERVEIFLLTW